MILSNLGPGDTPMVALSALPFISVSVNKSSKLIQNKDITLFCDGFFTSIFGNTGVCNTTKKNKYIFNQLKRE
jgi:hypothetical protein